MYPHSTIEDLQKAFPDALNPDSGVKKNFIIQGESTGPSDWNGYFTKEDELLTMGDGKKVAVVSMWTKPSFERIVNHAKQYGIVVAQFTEAEKGIGKKGGFALEYLNGYTPPVSKKKKSLLWLWILLGALLLAALAFFGLRKPAEPKIVEKVVEKIVVDTVTVVDTVFVQELEDLEAEFNAIQFEQGKAELQDKAKFVLHDLSNLMQKYEELKIKIVGHTSAEGDATVNQKLSENRAKAAVDFLISDGISEERLLYEGKGSSEPLDPNNPEINRRTEFIEIK